MLKDQLPTEILTNIYQYDNTYRIIYNDIIHKLKIKFANEAQNISILKWIQNNNFSWELVTFNYAVQDNNLVFI